MTTLILLLISIKACPPCYMCINGNTWTIVLIIVMLSFRVSVGNQQCVNTKYDSGTCK